MEFLSKIITTVCFFVVPEAYAKSQAIELSGEFISMAQTAENQAKAARLAVITADLSQPRRQRIVNWISKTRQDPAAPSYQVVQRTRVPDAAASFDVCQLDPLQGEQTLLFLDRDGVTTVSGERLVQTETLLAHARDDALPQIKLCFNLFADEAPALIIPRLHSIEVWRAETPRRYKRIANLEMTADLRFFGQNPRDQQNLPTQSLLFRLETPDIAVTHFNGDDKADICLCHEDQLSCYVQDANGFAPGAARHHDFAALSIAEENDASMRIDCQMVELNGDRRVDLTLRKSRFDLSDMQSSLAIFIQDTNGGFPRQANQMIQRTGYFAFQQYVDINDDGKIDILAPVASLSWTDLASIYLSRRADIDFVYYRNNGSGTFEREAKLLHKLSYPVDPKNWNAILGVLPQTNVKLINRDASERQILFFPDQKAVALYTMKQGNKDHEPAWRYDADLGSANLTLDLDRDGKQELVFAYPRDTKRSRRLLFIEASTP